MRCAECKGKGLCGLERCPVISRFHAQLTMKPSDHYMGGAPSVFVGSYGYPNVSGGPLLINDPDTPPTWVDRGLSIDDIVGLRARTIRGTSAVARVVDNMQEIALSSRPLDVEVRFTKPVAVDVRFDGTVAPVGLSGAIRKMDVIDNARVERAVDKITSDTDLGAVDACSLLHESSIDVYRITEILTTGLLGKKRRIVPTRWAITAVDDMVSNQAQEEYRPLPVDRGLPALRRRALREPYRLHPRSGRLEVRDDRDLGAPVPLVWGNGDDSGRRRGAEKGRLLAPRRRLLLRPSGSDGVSREHPAFGTRHRAPQRLERVPGRPSAPGWSGRLPGLP